MLGDIVSYNTYLLLNNIIFVRILLAPFGNHLIWNWQIATFIIIRGLQKF